MKPSARVTAQALHRAMGFGAIAFLVIHIVLEIIAGRSQPADAVIPFLDKGRTFYLGLGTVASDMFIVIMMTGIYRARLAARMSPKAWRVIHASAYAAWIFGLVHGLLAGRPAKSFFGFSGFVAWSYGACVVAVAAALMVRLVAKNRAGNELASHPVADSGGTGGWTAAAAALTGAGALPGAAALTATAMPAPALPAGSPGALDGARSRASRQPGRAQLALPAGASAAPQRGHPARSAPYDERAAYLAENRRIGASGPIGPGATGSFERTGQFGGPGLSPRERAGEYEPTGPMPRVPQHGHTGPLPRVAPYEQTGPMPRAGQYEQGRLPVRADRPDRPPGPDRPLGRSTARPVRASPARPMRPGPVQPGLMYGGQCSVARCRAARMPGGRARAASLATGQPCAKPDAAVLAAPVQYGQPMSRQYGQTGPYERPHDDWSGPMERIGPSAAAPRYAAGNYNDWSGPLERIDPAAPPSQYGAPAQYGSPAHYGSGQYPAGQYARGPVTVRPARARPGVRPARRHRPVRPPARRAAVRADRRDRPLRPSTPSPVRAAVRPAPVRCPGAAVPPARIRAALVRPGGQPGQPMPRQRERSGAYERPHPAQYQQSAGYEQGPQGQYETPMPVRGAHAVRASTSATTSTRRRQYQRDDPYQRGPGGQAGQYSRPDYDQPQRAEHYASFADQDAAYTRPRPPGARDQFSPQDETDPLNIVPLNIGNYS